MTPQLLFTPNSTPIKPLTQTTSHPLSVGVIHWLLFVVLDLFALPLSHVFCRCCILRSIFSWSPVTLFSQPTKKIITSAKWKCIYSLMWAWKRGSHAGNEKIRATLVFCFVLVFFFADFSFIWVVWNNNPLTFWCGSVPLSVTSRDQTNLLVHYRSLLFTLFTCQPLEIILDDKSRFAEMET